VELGEVSKARRHGLSFHADIRVHAGICTTATSGRLQGWVSMYLKTRCFVSSTRYAKGVASEGSLFTRQEGWRAP
jgi:hypothetical protein